MIAVLVNVMYVVNECSRDIRDCSSTGNLDIWLQKVLTVCVGMPDTSQVWECGSARHSLMIMRGTCVRGAK